MKNAVVKPCMTTITEQQENSTYKYARLDGTEKHLLGTNCSNLDGKI